MKSSFLLLPSLMLACFAPVCAQQVYYTPNDLTALAQATGDPSVWEITVTGGGIQAGVYDAWCFSPDLPGYTGSDFGQNFESTLISINGMIQNEASPGINKAGAMVNYVFDMYYGFWNEAGLDSSEIQDRFIGFHHILWEIQKDYNPEFGFSSFDLLSGGHVGGSSFTRDLISGDLSSVYASLSEDYTSGQYDLKVIDGRNVLKNGSPLGGSIQPLIVVSVIPEPSAFLMGGIAAGMLVLRRRRSA
jgi:hypothetical protein